MKFTHTLNGAALLMAAIALSQSAAIAAPDGIMISQKNRTYAPAAVTLLKGETLKIINDDIFLHHAFIDSDKMTFDSGSQKKGTVVEIAFKEYGVYEVLCAIHPKMKLEVTVE